MYVTPDTYYFEGIRSIAQKSDQHTSTGNICNEYYTRVRVSG